MRQFLLTASVAMLGIVFVRHDATAQVISNPNSSQPPAKEGYT